MNIIDLLRKDTLLIQRLRRTQLPGFPGFARGLARQTQLLEVVLLIVWALWVGRAYLNFDPLAYPQGGDFPHEVQGHFFWHLLPQCGYCFLWNGYLDGGSPSFAELQGAALHPLAAFGSLVWGTINGEKFMLLCSLVIAGLAQWWLARTMGLGWLARVWSGMIIVVCGQWSGYLINGVTNMVFAVANASLILAPAVDLALNRSRRSVVWLGVALALTVLAGQGYIQIGVVFAILPALLVFVLYPGRQAGLWKDYLLSGVLALLLSAVMIVPVLHFLPAFQPETGIHSDMTQSLATVFFNFVSPTGLTLNYHIFVGWIPVILALFALRLAPREKNHLLWFLITAILLVCALSTIEWITALVTIIPRLAAARFPILISGLAVPPLIALAAWGLDLLVKRGWPSVSINYAGGGTLSTAKTWLLLVIPLGAAILIAYPIGRQSMTTVSVSKPADVIQAVQTDTAQWVRFSSLDFLWAPFLIEKGNFKLTDVYRPWQWLGRTQPKPYIEAYNKRDAPVQPPGILLKTVQDYVVYADTANDYAAVTASVQAQGGAGSGSTACRSRSLGGNIDVTCDSPFAGVLVVQENAWSGWTARIDNKPAALKPGPWLAVDAPAGKHTYTFRYLPWDVPLGFAVSLCGIGLAAWLLIRSHRAPVIPAE